MNSISFGSTYKINLKNDIQKQDNLTEFCCNNGLDYSSKLESTKVKSRGFSTPVTRINSTVIAPDEKDGLIEAYLANQGIKFKKLDSKELLSKSKIEARVEKPLQDRHLVKIDAKKLDKLIHNQDQNIDYCEKNYENYYRDDVDTMIKSGDKITATSLYIIPLGESVKDTVKYINAYGADRLNDNQLSFVFNQESDEPDHCTFFGMKDLGMNEIPVYVDNDTLKLGKALELIK